MAQAREAVPLRCDSIRHFGWQRQPHNTRVVHTLNKEVPEFVMAGRPYDEGLGFAGNKLHILNYSLNGARFPEQSDSLQAAVHSIVFRDSALFDRCSLPPQ